MKYQWTVLTVTTVGILMSGIDNSILVVGLPKVAAALHSDAEQAVWFTQSYALAGTIMLLLMGRITDIFGRLKIYKAGFIVFTVGSLLVSLSQTADQMIVFRIIQGMGTASLWSSSLALLTDSTPTRELGFSLGINQVAGRIGGIFGLTLSGVILLFFDWRFLFYINVPIGIFGTLWAHLKLKELGTRESGSPIDWFGFAAFSIFLTGITLSLTFAAYGISETGAVVAFLLLASVVSLMAFIVHERRTKFPLLDLSLLRIREFSASTFGVLLSWTSTSSLLLLFSLYLQLVVGVSPFLAGSSLLPAQIAMVVAGPISGRFSDRLGKMPFLVGGLVLASVSAFMFSTVEQVTPYFYVALYLGIFGVGISAFLAPNASLGMAAVPANRRGIASSLRNLSFNVSSSLGFSLAIWLVTLSVPYGVVSSVISSGNAALIPEAYRVAFFSGLRSAYIWLAIMNAFALIPTLIGARKNKNRQIDSKLVNV
ncbi:MAG: MFS transporter [Rhabdochlamydiaceae bacterium]